jgi:hypothetical protein
MQWTAELGVVGALELLVAEDEIEILIQLLVFSSLDGALLELLEAVHPPRPPQRPTALCLLPHALHLLREIEGDGEDCFL